MTKDKKTNKAISEWIIFGIFLLCLLPFPQFLAVFVVAILWVERPSVVWKKIKKLFIHNKEKKGGE